MARAWLEAHAHDPGVAGAALPQDHHRDPETGETLEWEVSGWLVGDRRPSEGHRGVLSYSHLRHELDPNLHHRALVGRGPRSRAELDVRVRLDRAMEALRKDQQDLLRMKYAEQMTNLAIAAELGVDESAIRRKLTVAAQDLYKAIGGGWSLPVDMAAELFGNRAREGRPARDRKGEQLAAELAFEGYLAHREEGDDV